MSGLGGLNKGPGGMTVGVCQFQLPTVETPAQLEATAARIVEIVRRTKAGNAALDLLVFPEYSLHGLSMNVDDALMCTLDGPEVASFQAVCKETKTWGCFSLMEKNPGGYPWNSGIVIDATGDIVLYYRKLHPWVPVEPWHPGDLGIPVCDGPAGSKIALIICHDGMFPEMAREAAYKGANVMLRTAGYTAPIRHAWKISNQHNAFSNLMYTVNVCLAGTDGMFRSMGEGSIVNFDGTVLVEGGGFPDEVITSEIVPSRADEARVHWGVENNIYQLGHRGYAAVAGGATDCPYTFMQDLVKGDYRLPWEADVRTTDGRAYGFEPLAP
jgi:formamidase